MKKILFNNEKGELFPVDKTDEGLAYCCERYNKQVNKYIKFIKQRLDYADSLLDVNKAVIINSSNPWEDIKLRKYAAFVKNAKGAKIFPFKRNLFGEYTPTNKIYKKYFEGWCNVYNSLYSTRRTKTTHLEKKEVK